MRHCAPGNEHARCTFHSLSPPDTVAHGLPRQHIDCVLATTAPAALTILHDDNGIVPPPGVMGLPLQADCVMRSNFVRLCLALALCVTATASITAQQTPPAGPAPLRVFFDCSSCDMDFMRTEIRWIDYMRDRADAQVHVLVTPQGTGGGGRRYTVELIGLRDLAGTSDTLFYTSTSDDTPDITRRGLTGTIGAGLLRFVTGTPAIQRLSISFLPPAGGRPQAPGAPPAGGPPARDPWNFWTFSIGMNGSGNGESQQKSMYLSSSISANRTTEQWKMSFGVNGSYNEQKFNYTVNGVDFETASISRNYFASSLVVKSLGPHLSAGMRASASTSTFGNTELSVTFAPAVEYNFIPYSESTRRSLLVQYSVGLRYYDYREVTIYGEVEETRPVHTLSVGYSTRQPWGSVSGGVNGSQFLHDTQKYNVGIGGGGSVRLFKGFSFNANVNYARIRDRITLAGRNLTQEEILLRQRQLATNYQYFMNAGISYRFGSIFNSVVNPRFGNSGFIEF
jgi:hypothetical protein